MPHTKLYDILNVEPSASHEEIVKAYRMRALKIHPDKNKGDPDAKAAFQHLQRAFDILKDDKKRKIYDETGSQDENGFEFEEAVKFCQAYFNSVTEEEIESFKESYKDSQEEREDLIDFYNRNDGDVSRIFETVILAEPGECDRFLDIFSKLITKGDIIKTDAFVKSSKALPKKADSFKRKYAKEAKEAREGKTARRSSGSKIEGIEDDSSVDVSDMSALVGAIQKNKKRNADQTSSFLDRLEAKYCTENQGNKSTSTTRRPAKKRG